MPLFTQEQIRNIRLKGSRLLAISAIDKAVRVVRMSSTRALEAGELQAAVKAGTRRQSELVVFMMTHAIADEAGNMLTPEDAATLCDLLPVGELTRIVDVVNEVMAAGLENKEPDAREVLTPGKD